MIATKKCASQRPAHRMFVIAALACLSIGLSGCCQYGQNRLYDFCDIFQFGGGVTSQNPKAGITPPAIGVYVQATEYMNLGAVYFNGSLAEMDGRGFYAGPEEHLRYGLFCYQGTQINQNYLAGSENYFKKSKCLWTKRMNSNAMRWNKTPAKELDYEYFAEEIHEGFPIMPRGWQYWENVAVELGISEPFLTHLGFDIRVGIDPSEISDFILGIFTIDYNNDDLTAEEYKEMTGMAASTGSKVVREPKPASE
ncbi:MAG: hypothetical protein NTX50_27165 [Candidatus Sumerlaeota bacterium]|nr:hypothetical protein [Candidatus Sumerlaeota bacterium]